MKFTKPIITAAAAVGISVAMAATASAYSTVGKFGTYERLYDAGGAVVTAWTVDNLKPSTDRIPRVPAARHAVGGHRHHRARPGHRHAADPQPQRPRRQRPELPSPLGGLHAAGHQRRHHPARRTVHRQDLFRRHRPNTIAGDVQQRSPRPADLGEVSSGPRANPDRRNRVAEPRLRSRWQFPRIHQHPRRCAAQEPSGRPA